MLKPILFLLISLTLYAETINGVAVLVKDEPITLHDVRAEMAASGKDAKQSAELLIRKKLESIEAKERRISVSSEEVYADLEAMAEQNNIGVLELYSVMQSSRGIGEKELKAKIKEKLLNQKLYNAIAFSQMSQPTADEEAEYYQMHKSEFAQPESFSVIAYRSASKQKLQEKTANLMLISAEVKSENVTLPYGEIDPRLAGLLSQTAEGTFTPVLPDEQGFVSFFVQKKNNIVTRPLESVRTQIANAIVGEKRTQVLNDYFARLRLNAEIKTLRLPE